MRLRLAAGYLAVAMVLFTGCASERQVAGSPVSAVSTEEPADPEADIEAVRSTFESYRTEVAAGNGAVVPALVSPSTVAHYEEVVRLARTAGPSEIAARGMLDRLIIALLRVQEPLDFATMDGAGLLAYGVGEGMIDAAVLEGSTLGDVRVRGDRAYAEMLVDGEPTGVGWDFVREGSKWTFDLAAAFPLINEALSQVAADDDVTEDEFIFTAVELVTGTPVDMSVYEAP